MKSITTGPMTCKHKPTEWESKFYGMCGACYIHRNQADPKATQGEWSRNVGVQKQTHAKDILQPTNKDGQYNRDFIKAHGTQMLQKESGMTHKAIVENADKYG